MKKVKTDAENLWQKLTLEEIKKQPSFKNVPNLSIILEGGALKNAVDIDAKIKFILERGNFANVNFYELIKANKAHEYLDYFQSNLSQTTIEKGLLTILINVNSERQSDNKKIFDFFMNHYPAVFNAIFDNLDGKKRYDFFNQVANDWKFINNYDETQNKISQIISLFSNANFNKAASNNVSVLLMAKSINESAKKKFLDKNTENKNNLLEFLNSRTWSHENEKIIIALQSFPHGYPEQDIQACIAFFDKKIINNDINKKNKKAAIKIL